MDTQEIDELPDTWTCSCTYENVITDSKCAMCEEPRVEEKTPKPEGPAGVAAPRGALSLGWGFSDSIILDLCREKYLTIRRQLRHIVRRATVVMQEMGAWMRVLVEAMMKEPYVAFQTAHALGQNLSNVERMFEETNKGLLDHTRVYLSYLQLQFDNIKQILKDRERSGARLRELLGGSAEKDFALIDTYRSAFATLDLKWKQTIRDFLFSPGLSEILAYLFTAIQNFWQNFYIGFEIMNRDNQAENQFGISRPFDIIADIQFVPTFDKFRALAANLSGVVELMRELVEDVHQLEMEGVRESTNLLKLARSLQGEEKAQRFIPGAFAFSYTNPVPARIPIKQEPREASGLPEAVDLSVLTQDFQDLVQEWRKRLEKAVDGLCKFVEDRRRTVHGRVETMMNEGIVYGYFHSCKTELGKICKAPLFTANTDTSELLCGWLSKANSSWGWRRRWFVLRENSLDYYANKDDVQKLPRRIFIKGALVQAVPNTTHLSILPLDKRRQFEFDAETAENTHRWVEALRCKALIDSTKCPLASCLFAQQTVFENQRFNVFSGWGSNGNFLLSTDRGRWSDEKGTANFGDGEVPSVGMLLTDLGHLHLVDSAATTVLPPERDHWQKVVLGADCDPEGWRYGFDFSSFGRKHEMTEKTLKTWVRRRAWSRYFVLDNWLKAMFQRKMQEMVEDTIENDREEHAASTPFRHLPTLEDAVSSTKSGLSGWPDWLQDDSSHKKRGSPHRTQTVLCVNPERASESGT